MGADKNIIVAIELGSSAIRGIAGQREADGSTRILAIEQENVEECIRRGNIFNIDKTTRAIRLIKERLEDRLNVTIKRAYVGLCGQSLHSESNKIQHNLGQYIKITSSHIDRLRDENNNTRYAKREILEAVPQEYYVDGTRTNEPEGIQGSALEGNFLNIIAFNTLSTNIHKCLNEAGLQLAEILITPIEEAKSILTESEKRSGCALIDMGAETTTLSIYCNNILRHMVVIPLGGRNITEDISAICNVSMEEAEMLKIKQTAAYSDKTDDGDSKEISLSNERAFAAAKLQDIVEARTEEIIRNIDHQIAPNLKEKLLSGIIITGGAAHQAKLAEAMKKVAKFDKVKVARNLSDITPSEPSITANESIALNALIALFLGGTEDCAVEKRESVTPENPVIEPEYTAEPSGTEEEEPREDERRPKKKEEKRKISWIVDTDDPDKEDDDDDEDDEDDNKRKGDKKGNKMKGISGWLKKMLDEDEE